MKMLAAKQDSCFCIVLSALFGKLNVSLYILYRILTAKLKLPVLFGAI